MYQRCSYHMGELIIIVYYDGFQLIPLTQQEAVLSADSVGSIVNLYEQRTVTSDFTLYFVWLGDLSTC